MSLKLYKPNQVQKFMIGFTPYICSRKLKTYFEKLDELTLSRIERLRRYSIQSSDFAKEESLRCAYAIKDLNPGQFSKSYPAMILLSVYLGMVENFSKDEKN